MYWTVCWNEIEGNREQGHKRAQKMILIEKSHYEHVSVTALIKSIRTFLPIATYFVLYRNSKSTIKRLCLYRKY